MHLANAAKIVAVDSLDVIASNVITLSSDNTAQNSIHVSPVTGYDKFAAILDAKRSQFFIAVYEQRPNVHSCTGAQADTRQSSIVNRQYDSTSHQSPITNYQSPITNYQLPITNHQTSISGSSSISNRSLTLCLIASIKASAKLLVIQSKNILS